MKLCIEGDVCGPLDLLITSFEFSMLAALHTRETTETQIAARTETHDNTHTTRGYAKLPTKQSMTFDDTTIKRQRADWGMTA